MSEIALSAVDDQTQALAEDALATILATLAAYRQLMGQINLTRDPKGIAELQARIAVEQAAVQNETTKLQLVGMLQRAEERLIEQQKSDLAQRILSASNRGMPPCCSADPGAASRR